ncbi:MAG: DUF3285 domain-containing protein [Leptolyngbyaceae cyanobacterium bins.302]|nr:DUF3285 domain-containing protein [Leptolyngbyaceae cyanobacterium bins.302]
MATENLSSEDVDSSQAVEISGREDSTSSATPQEPKPSYVKLAMRNMVRKRGKSLQHFFLTTIALLGVFVGLAYLTR